MSFLSGYSHQVTVPKSIVRYRNPFQASKSHFRKVLGVLPLVAAFPSTLLARVFGASFYSIFIDLRTDTDVYNFGTC